MKHLVCGVGEIGSALKSILDCDGHDLRLNMLGTGDYDILHICFAYTNNFEQEVETLKKQYNAKYVCVHSTVPIGTCKKLGACHSPVRGKHPNLKKSILTFEKYVAGKDAEIIAKELEKYGINTKVVEDSNNTEAGKLFDLMQYGIAILLNKDIWDQCQKLGLDFDVVYTEFNGSYNDGYEALEEWQFVRPILEHIEGAIGGHCIAQNMDKLTSVFAKMIIEYQNKWIKS